jgi:hypothetical protein
MNIFLDPATNYIRLGRKRLPLHSSHEHIKQVSDFYCESHSDVQFSDIWELQGLALPKRILLQTSADRSHYGHLFGIDVVRTGRSVRFVVSLSYSAKRWNEPVHLNKFCDQLAKALRSSGEVKSIQRIVNDYDSGFVDLDLIAEFPAADPLFRGYRRVVALLKAKHEFVLDRMMDSVHRRVVLKKVRAIRDQGRQRYRGVPQAFICHDSRDKRSIAARVATGLAGLRCHVWYDDFSLCIGDPLRESIEEGLRTCRKCILILSPNFLSNGGWTKAEFNAAFTREIVERNNVLLPVWAGVTKNQVYAYSPVLADRLGIDWGRGSREVVSKLYAAIMDP